MPAAVARSSSQPTRTAAPGLLPLRPIARTASFGALLGLSAAALPAFAQTPQTAQTQQVVKPPQAQVWIDMATIGGLGLPGMGNPMAMVSSLFGGGGGSNSFGQTQSMSAGRWVDVTIASRQAPQLAEAQHSVPAGFLNPPLKLVSPKETKGIPVEPGDERILEPEYEKPKGRLLLYWGCGDKVRAGQPRVVDFATATPADLGRVFQSRRATLRGTHQAVGRPVWPNPSDSRNVPEQASLAGEHAFSGPGVPTGLRFNIPAAQDLMPALALQQTDQAGVTQLEWQALPTARAYFISGMGSGMGGGENDMVLWTSSEQPDAGFGLVDYQTNAAVDRWLKEQVLLTPQTTRCAVPKGVFSGQGAMLRMIAYGSELNLAQPPRPTDPKQPWEPVWAAKIRVKSVTTAVLGLDMGMGGDKAAQKDKPAEADKDAAGAVKDLLKGIFGR
jgi:hypothetical protein